MDAPPAPPTAAAAPDPAPQLRSPTEILFAWLAAAPHSCPNCDYALTGLTRPICPECGVTLELRVRPAEPRARAYMAGFLGLTAGLGFAAIMTLLFVLFTATMGPGPNPGRFITTSLTGAGVLGSLLFVWRRRRRDFSRLTDRTRAALAVGAWLLSITYVAIFASIVGLR